MAKKFLPYGVQPLTTLTFTSTLGVGSIWTSDTIDTTHFQSFVGICGVDSSNIILSFNQGGVSGTFDVSSTIACPVGGTTLGWTTIAQYAQLSVTTVNSSLEEELRIHLYGIPTN